MYVQASVVPEGFVACMYMYRLQCSWDLKMCPIREVSSCQRGVTCIYISVVRCFSPDTEVAPVRRHKVKEEPRKTRVSGMRSCMQWNPYSM